MKFIRGQPPQIREAVAIENIPYLLRSCAGPTAPSRPQVKVDQAVGVVVAFSDIPEGNAAAMHIGGIDHCAGYGRAIRPHGRGKLMPPTCHQPFYP